MRRRISIGIISVVTLGLVLGGIYMLSAEQLKKENIYPQLELFSGALSIIHNGYVEDVTTHDLIYGALKGMLTSLDPHSQFLDPDEFKELKVETEGQFGGLGIEITIKDNLLTIITPIEDTPAWKAGIMAGDRIVKIEGELTRNITLSEAVKKLRGKPGTEVALTILRESESRILEIKIVRDIIKIKDIKKAVILEDGIGYIRLIEFRENSAKEFKAALKRLQDEGMQALILDVRFNPGGLLNVAIDITSSFLPNDTLVVSTQGRNPASRFEFKSRVKDPLLDIPMVVLINEGSASGSEILAGALQDYNRALILGTKSFGKGSVQTVLPMNDGSALRLTTSKYFTPSERSIHNVGIEPDIEVKAQFISEAAAEEDTEDVFKKLENEKKKPEKDSKEENINKDDDFYLRDSQLLRALDLLKAIKVYNKVQKIG
ncbi:MAG: S41 family peptidase [Candidatus Omnitrophica bacterium]|nr:S41 family peptidase [Candidatus Omnitrophota bacterium]